MNFIQKLSPEKSHNEYVVDQRPRAYSSPQENATTRGLVSAFTKYTNGRVTNRVLLNRFIGLIA